MSHARGAPAPRAGRGGAALASPPGFAACPPAPPYGCYGGAPPFSHVRSFPSALSLDPAAYAAAYSPAAREMMARARPGRALQRTPAELRCVNGAWGDAGKEEFTEFRAPPTSVA